MKPFGAHGFVLLLQFLLILNLSDGQPPPQPPQPLRPTGPAACSPTSQSACSNARIIPCTVSAVPCPAPQPICTRLKNEFLFKETPTESKTGINYDDPNTPIHLCRPYDYDQTITKLKAKMKLVIGAPCDPDTQNRLLMKSHQGGRYHNDLELRLSSLEDIAHSSASNSQLCQLHEFGTCVADESTGNAMGRCQCHPRLTSGGSSCINGAKQYSACGVTRLLDPAYDAADPFDEGSIFLHSDYKLKSIQIQCLNLPAGLGQLSCVTSFGTQKTCLCTENQRLQDIGNNCASDFGQILGFISTQRIEDYYPRDGALNGKQKIDLLAGAMKELESKMTLIEASDNTDCNEAQERELDEVWRFVDELNDFDKSKPQDAQTKLMKDFDDITGTVTRLALQAGPNGRLCGVKKDASGAPIKDQYNDGRAIRLLCQENPPTSGIWKCFPKEYTQLDISTILKNLKMDQVHYKVDPSRSVCSDVAQTDLEEIYDHFYRINFNSKDADEKLKRKDFDRKLQEFLTKYPRANNVKYCSRKQADQGLVCKGGQCVCDDAETGNYVEKDGKCLVKFGRPCDMCVVPELGRQSAYRPCAKDGELYHECEEGGACEKPEGDPPTSDSRECIRITPLGPVPQFPAVAGRRLAGELGLVAASAVWLLMAKL